jgi:hypothetical protein
VNIEMSVQAILVATILVILIVAISAIYKLGKCRGRNMAAKKEGYLVYPYIDLVEPGARGNYYAMSEIS